MSKKNHLELLHNIFLILASICAVLSPLVLIYSPVAFVVVVLIVVAFIALASISKETMNGEKNRRNVSMDFDGDNSEDQTPKDEISRHTFLPKILKENILVYEYINDIYFFGDGIKYVAGNVDQLLDFVQEPESEYDINAIAIYLNGHKLGYVCRSGPTQNMINDWIRRGEFFFGFLNKYSPANDSATFRIGFYKPLSQFPCKTFSLVKTGKKADEFTKRSEYLSFCSEGDIVSVHYDCFDDTYIVSSDSLDEIGELPKSAGNFLSRNEFENIIGIIDKLDDEFDRPPKAKVKIYRLD